MGAIVYGVSKCEYSDYEVCAIFENVALAEAYLEGKGKWVPCEWRGLEKNPLPHDINCQGCRGFGRKFEHENGDTYHIEEWPWNPDASEDDACAGCSPCLAAPYAEFVAQQLDREIIDAVETGRREVFVRVADEEGAQGYWPPFVLVWRGMAPWRVAIYTPAAKLRMQLRSMAEAIDVLGQLGDVSTPEKIRDEDTWRTTYEALKNGAFTVELRPISELDKQGA